MVSGCIRSPVVIHFVIFFKWKEHEKTMKELQDQQVRTLIESGYLKRRSIENQLNGYDPTGSNLIPHFVVTQFCCFGTSLKSPRKTAFTMFYLVFLPFKTGIHHIAQPEKPSNIGCISMGIDPTAWAKRLA